MGQVCCVSHVVRSWLTLVRSSCATSHEHIKQLYCSKVRHRAQLRVGRRLLMDKVVKVSLKGRTQLLSAERPRVKLQGQPWDPLHPRALRWEAMQQLLQRQTKRRLVTAWWESLQWELPPLELSVVQVACSQALRHNVSDRQQLVTPSRLRTYVDQDRRRPGPTVQRPPSSFSCNNSSIYNRCKRPLPGLEEEAQSTNASIQAATLQCHISPRPHRSLPFPRPPKQVLSPSLQHTDRGRP